MGKFEAHYQALFGAIQQEHGPLDDETLGSIIGFDAGGPVSLSSIAREALYVTCELSVYPEQVPSTEGLQYELLVRGWLDEADAQALLTALGDLSMREGLGHRHTIDVAGILSVESICVVRLQEYCRTSIAGRPYGIYEVVDASAGR